MTREKPPRLRVSLTGDVTVVELVDRRILDEMREPVIHLVRNCIDLKSTAFPPLQLPLQPNANPRAWKDLSVPTGIS